MTPTRTRLAGLRRLDRRGVLSALVAGGASLGLGVAHAASDPTAGEKRAGPGDVLANADIVRWAAGDYAYRRLSDGSRRGGESFFLTVQPDGSRTMRASTDIAARDVQVDVVLRTDGRFRPVEAFVSEWTQGRFKGSALLRVAGGEMTVDIGAPVGAGRQTLAAPDHFSLLTHPLALDGWHSWYAAPTIGASQAGSVFKVDGAPDPAAPFAVRAIPITIAYAGSESIKVPAGRFQTDHFILLGGIHVWVTGPDHLLVRYVDEREDREYFLTALRTRGMGLGGVFSRGTAHD